MGDLLDAIINFIIAAGKASVKDTDIFKEYASKDPNDVIILYEYAGSAPAPFTNMSVRSIQVVVRSKQSQTAKTKSWGLYNLFHKSDSFIIIGARKCLIEMRNTPIKIGVDSTDRILWAFNMALTTNLD